MFLSWIFSGLRKRIELHIISGEPCDIWSGRYEAKSGNFGLIEYNFRRRFSFILTEIESKYFSKKNHLNEYLFIENLTFIFARLLCIVGSNFMLKKIKFIKKKNDFKHVESRFGLAVS